MTSTVERVLEDFLRSEVDHLPPIVGSAYEQLFVSPRHSRHFRRHLAGPITAAAAVVAVIAGVVIVSAPARHDNAIQPAAGWAVPATISIPTSVPSVLEQPMERAALLVQTGNAADTQAISSDPILISSDGRTYRRLPTIATGAAPGSVTLSAFALSPDGTRVAYADWSRAAPASSALRVVELATGDVISFAMPGVGLGEQLGNLSWSPDGTRIAYSGGSVTQLPTPEGKSTPDDAILDLATGRRTPLPATPFGWSADGRQLLLGPPYASGTMYPDTNAFEIVNDSGKTLHTVPTGSLLNVDLSGGIWSSTTHTIATVTRGGDSASPWTQPQPYTLQLISDQTGKPALAGKVELGSLVGVSGVAGWLDADHVAVTERQPNEPLRVVSIDVNTRAVTVITQATSTAITGIHIAA